MNELLSLLIMMYDTINFLLTFSFIAALVSLICMIYDAITRGTLWIDKRQMKVCLSVITLCIIYYIVILIIQS